MTHTKPQLLTRRNHRVTVSQSQLRACAPCTMNHHYHYYRLLIGLASAFWTGTGFGVRPYTWLPTILTTLGNGSASPLWCEAGRQWREHGLIDASFAPPDRDSIARKPRRDQPLWSAKECGDPRGLPVFCELGFMTPMDPILIGLNLFCQMTFIFCTILFFCSRRFNVSTPRFF